MKILFAAPENAWGGFLGLVREALPEHYFEATGGFQIDSLKGYDVLIPTMCPVTEEILQDQDQLQLIQQCGAGLEGVDLEAARSRDIWVANVPTDISGNADSVAELGIYMMIGLSRNFREMADSLRHRKMGVPQGRSLSGRTVGIVGLGGIGRALIKRLKAFNVHLIGIKRYNPQAAKKELGLEWVGGPNDLRILLGKSDYVILSLPLTVESKFLMNAESFSWMKNDAYLINLSRGGLVNHDALRNALSAGQIAGAGLDVFWEEPPSPDDTIFSFNVMATPHIAGSTDVSMRGIVKVVAENIRRVDLGLAPHYNEN
ncbi:MAG: NAD(P)-dependent oxidoreductase [Desulfobacterales bacterium]|jgi:phosphoglycerate dehydrogenase-like enzyme